jgi:hypothetical protein
MRNSQAKEKEMNSTYQRLMLRLLFLAIPLVLVALSACTSKSDSKTRERGTATSDSSGSHIDLMCIGERINNPPEAFHYSYKYSDASSSTDKEAEITPQSMEITIKDQSGSHSFHGVRSDEVSWNSAVLDLSGLGMTAMMSRFDALNGTSAMTRQANESMNGYDTTRYAIDSTTAGASDQRKFAALFGTGSFEKGTVWVPADGCAVKLALDERVFLNGNLKDAHYELARTRK